MVICHLTFSCPEAAILCRFVTLPEHEQIQAECLHAIPSNQMLKPTMQMEVTTSSITPANMDDDLYLASDGDEA